MTDTEAKVVAVWREAAAELGFSFTSPYVVTLPDGSWQERLGLVHFFGRRKGTLISVLGEPSERLHVPGGGRPGDDDHFSSILGPGYCDCRREEIIETLCDWGYFGPKSCRPDWYVPAAHWGEHGPMGI